MAEEKYTDEELLEILKEYYNKNNKAEQRDFCNRNGLPSYQTYIKRFGSWNKAKSLINIPTNIRSKYNISPELIIDKFKNLVRELDRIPSSDELSKIKGFPSLFTLYKHFDNYDDFVNKCGFSYNKISNGKFKKDFLINEIKRFVEEFNIIPIQTDFENLKGYPSRKTFSNHFKDFNEVIRLAGYEPQNLSQKEYDLKYRNKIYLSGIINDYINKYDKIPTLDELIKEHNNFHSLKLLYEQVYGSWNKALIELELPLNQVSRYTDDFLESEFHRFVEKHGRIPTYAEFNNSEYPSFWCYQNRFGSWNKAVVNYGYEPNDENRKYILDDGEICASSYEFDISTWLKSLNIIYDRDVNYIDFIDNYKGKMNCDYVIHHNNKLWYVEMAGFLRGTDFNKYSDAEKNYFFKLKYKRKLLRRQGVNYLIIEPCDLKKKSLEEIFFFLFSEDEKDVS